MALEVTASVIIPVLNNPQGLERTLCAITKQSCAKDSFEVIVVDNGSDDPPRDMVETYGAIFIEESVHQNSPYSCRNRAIEIARGEVIVLLDSTCAPKPDWLEEGVRLVQSGCDMVGGKVVFDVHEGSSLGCLYDSLFNIRMRESILERGVAKTTNLFIHRRVIDCIGMFPEGLRSGGDVRWTGNATSRGFSLCFGEKAAVEMSARSFFKLVSKQYRVSKGMPAIWSERGGFVRGILKKGVFFWVPPNPVHLMRAIDSGGSRFMKKRFLGLFLVGWFLRLVSGLGIGAGVIIDLSNQITNKNVQSGATRDC